MNRKSIFSLVLLLALPLLAQALPAPIKSGARLRKFGKRVVRPVRMPCSKPEKFTRWEMSSRTTNWDLRLNSRGFKERDITSYTGARLKATGKTTSRKINKVEKQSAQANKTARAANGVAARSARANRLARLKLKKMTLRPELSKQYNFQSGIPTNLSRTVFEVQISKTPRNTASAFALSINGKTWGVTAAHVMENIRHNPFVKVKTNGGEIVAPISSFRIGNKKGNDVAIFEIPQEVLPHIQVLSPAEQLPAVGTEIQSPRFVWGQPAFIPKEDILFAGQHRILLRNQVHQDITGSCGSPILADGKVIGIHVGSFSSSTIETISWSELLRDNQIALASTSFHVVSPIEQALQLAAQETTQAGTTLKVMGYPVHLMSPQEYISSISLLRNGFVKKEIPAHPFMNFENLGEFFELQENDVVRITLQSPKPYSPKMVTKIFDVNVSSGEITQTDR